MSRSTNEGSTGVTSGNRHGEEEAWRFRQVHRKSRRQPDRLMSQFEHAVKQAGDDDDELADQLDRFARIVKRRYEEGEIDDEEHDLLIEEVEDAHPDGKSFARLGDVSDEFYDSDDIPDAPELKVGKDVDLDELLQGSRSESTGSWGADEYDEYRQRMAEEFMRESDEAIASGDHQMVQLGPRRWSCLR